MPLSLDGGNLLGNGDDVCLTTNSVISANAHRGYDVEAIGRILCRSLGTKRWIYIRGLEREQTGHVDMICTFISNNTVVVGQLAPEIDAENARRLDDSAERLSGVTTAYGPLRVERIPMGSNADGIFRSYTNVVYANGVLVVPTYPDVDPTTDELVLARYSELMPDWKVVGIDVSKMAKQHGALHCLTTNFPIISSPAIISKLPLPFPPTTDLPPTAGELDMA